MNTTDEYFYQSLDGGGEPTAPQLRLNWRELRVRVAFECPAYSLTDLNHMIALAHLGNPVDLVHWARDTHGEAVAILWSARVSYIPAVVAYAIGK